MHVGYWVSDMRMSLTVISDLGNLRDMFSPYILFYHNIIINHIVIETCTTFERCGLNDNVTLISTGLYYYHFEWVNFHKLTTTKWSSIIKFALTYAWFHTEGTTPHPTQFTKFSTALTPWWLLNVLNFIITCTCTCHQLQCPET